MSADQDDRRVRDGRIRQLSAMGWSLMAISVEVGVSDERVRQILKNPDPDVELLAKELKLRAELDDRQRHAEANRHRIKVIQHALDRIGEEREAKAIDKILGLS